VEPITGPRILVVEKDRDVGETLDALLREEGYEPTVVATGSEAMALVDRGGFALVVTDLLGWWPDQALDQELLLRERAYPTPVGILTAWPLDADMVRRVGFAFLAQKPFDMDDLSRHIGGVLATPVTAGCRG